MKIFKVIYYLFLSFVALVAIILLVSVFPITGNIKFLVVKSGSMEPTIKTGALVMIKPVASYQVGDIITFGAWGKTKDPITHRINQIKEAEGGLTYVTKGDANDSVDQKEVTSGEIHGQVLLNLPYLGYAIDTAKKPYGFMIIIIVPALIIIFDQVKKIFNEVSKIKQKKAAGSSEAEVKES